MPRPIYPPPNSIDRDKEPQKTQTNRIERTVVAAKTQHLPTEWIKNGNDISEAFVAYARPIVGALPVIERIGG